MCVKACLLENLEELAATLCREFINAVAIIKSPISQAILDFIKEKLRLRQLYSITQDPNTETTIGRLQKKMRNDINEKINNYYQEKILQLHYLRIRSTKVMVQDNKYPKLKRLP